MPQLDEMVVSAVALSGGKLVGRIRLQKVVYLLEKLGMNSGAPFEYHHYGPYSEAISDALADAKFWGKIKESVDFRVADGAPYSSFVTECEPPEAIGAMSASDARVLLQKFAGCTSTVLELAATIHWLAYVEKVADWKAEIEKRKVGKTGNGRIDQALALLKDIGLAPA